MISPRRPFGLLATTLAWALAVPAFSQTLGQGNDADIPWLRLTAALTLCLGLALGAVWALNSRLNGSSTPIANETLRRWLGRLGLPAAASSVRRARLTDVETMRVSVQVSVSVFKCDGRDFMIASTTQGQMVLVSLEAERPEADE